MPAIGTMNAQRREAKKAPPNSAMASTGEKFGGCGSTRVSAATTIRPASTRGPGANTEVELGESETGRFIVAGLEKVRPFRNG